MVRLWKSSSWEAPCQTGALFLTPTQSYLRIADGEWVALSDPLTLPNVMEALDRRQLSFLVDDGGHGHILIQWHPPNTRKTTK